MAVKINYQDLKEKVEKGWKRAKLAQHYGLNDSQIRNALRDCKLKIRKFREPSYEIEGLEENKNQLNIFNNNI